jgi:DNA-binding NarL/FixJ family response regulator
MSVKLFVADDHPTFVRTLSTLLAGDGYELVGTAPDGETAVERCLSLQPDVVLMDIQMPGIGGIEATRRIVDAAPQIAVIVLTMFDDDQSVTDALRAGARGYLVKGARQDEIKRTMEMVLDGHAVIGRAVVRHLAVVAADQHRRPVQPFPELTEREREVLAAIADGCDNEEIARRLYLSQKTVRNYVSMVLAKIHAATRAEAIVKARQHGLGTDPEHRPLRR